MKINGDIQLSQLLDIRSPEAIFEEVKYNFILNYHLKDFILVRKAFKSFNDLYEGNYPGYKACNTKFHDKLHTLEALLTISRLIDGYNIKNPKLPVHLVMIALIATIMHDTGYVQIKQDVKGTGAKYTLRHVDRSIDFMQKCFPKIGLNKKDFISAKNMVKCTGLEVNIPKIKFSSSNEKILGLMLGAADLLGQMSSRNYLEKLLFLYREFKEGNVNGYDSEFNLLEKTINFYKLMKERIQKDLSGVDRYVLFHFCRRYAINKNLYYEAIERQMRYLKKILRDTPDMYRNRLRRKV